MRKAGRVLAACSAAVLLQLGGVAMAQAAPTGVPQRCFSALIPNDVGGLGLPGCSSFDRWGHGGAEAALGWVPSTTEYWPQSVSQQETTPVTITSGVQWHTDTYQTVGGAQRAQVMDIDLTNPNIRFGAVEAGNKLLDASDETMSSMANRTGAVAGVNSDEFAINTTGQPDGMVVQNGVLQASPVASWPAEFEVLNDGQIEMQTETFSGTVTDTTTGATSALAGLNRIDQDALVAVTPELGAITFSSRTYWTIVNTTVNNDGSLTVNSVKTSQTAFPAVPSGQENLVARRGQAASTWLQGLKVGDRVTVSYNLAPYGLGSAPDDVATALSGAAYLAQNGQMAVPVTGGGENNISYPVIGLGVSEDGKYAIEAVFDGEESENEAAGLDRPQFAQWMLAHGAYNAIEFDSGGSAEMVARMPGQSQVSVLNTPSDGHERRVANGLFVYTNETSPQAATKAVVNNGEPLAVLPGTTEPVSAYATDALGNPASSQVSVSVEPSDLATATMGSGTTASVTAGKRAGSGWLVITSGQAVSRVPITVDSSPASLCISPSEPNLSNSATQQLTISGTARDGGTLTVGNQDVMWSVSPSSLGTVSSTGLFTAAATGTGLATVTATADGMSTTASVAVGSDATVVDPMTDVGNWALNTTNGATATLSESTTQTAQPSDSGSMDVHYTIPKSSGVSQVVFSPKDTIQIGDSPDGEAPTSIGLWVKGIGGTLGTPLANNELTLAESWIEVNGQTETFYPTGVTYDGWQLVTYPVPSGAQLPMTLSFLDFLVINPSATTSNDLYVSDLEALYSPRQPVTPTYTPIPQNPRWLSYTENPDQFDPNGTTVLTFGDSHLSSTDENSTGAVVTSDIATQSKALPPNARPSMVQSDGNLIDPGTVADADYGQQMLKSFGVPYHTAVGDSDIGQGANPENGNWTSVFGPTHYSYTDGPAEFIALDTAWEGILASDPYQVPAEEQYAWLVSQLNASKSKDIVLVMHASPYDPHPIANSQWTDRYEAQEYEQLLTNYQRTHPWVHVILLNGQARGFAEQVLNPEGVETPTGLPNFDVSDAGVPPYATTAQGGWPNYVLFHFLQNGDVQFAVQPVLASIAVTAPQASLASGASEQLAATGTTPAGDTMGALQVPIQDPASHEWTSSDPMVASVDPNTGELTARFPGTATITVESDGVTGTVKLTVTGDTHGLGG